MKTIEQRTEFLRAVNFTESERDEIDRVDDWIMSEYFTPAQYIVWLEKMLEGD